ncbi:hypothetical protein GCM10009850_014240 [Nonomuraea monospora]|uniref:Uncharacterized protein n=1 Tax=Nonomuraea monospora TaxID=568818 RepID=A0ABP5P2A2_9ACTN
MPTADQGAPANHTTIRTITAAGPCDVCANARSQDPTAVPPTYNPPKTGNVSADGRSASWKISNRVGRVPTASSTASPVP